MSDDPKLLRADADYYCGEWQKAVNKIQKLRTALKPFATAADQLEDYETNKMSIWERPCATDITCGDLRAAAKVILDTCDY